MKNREGLMRPKAAKAHVPHLQLEFILRDLEFEDDLPSPCK